MNVNSSLSEVSGVGDALAKKFAVLGLRSINDMIHNYPRRYDDFSEVELIDSIAPGMVSLKAQIHNVVGRYVRGRMHITEAVATDNSGSIKVVWFNQPYRASSLKTGQDYYISGEFGTQKLRMNIINPSVELVQDFPVNTARIIPVYRETKGLKSSRIRKVVRQLTPLISGLPDTLPDWLVHSQGLVTYAEALESIHFAPSKQALQHARRRFGFEEVFGLTLASLLNKQDLQQESAISVPFDEKLARRFASSLPFQLTDAQRRAAWQIYLNMQATIPMNRLLEGDVGSGKTVVAAMASAMVMSQGMQAALMAPTELLARQHAETLHSLLKPLGMSDKVGLLIGAMTSAQKKRVKERIKAGAVTCIIGTHALLQESVDMNSLGLIVIDEQHRFGVEQRKALQAKAGHAVHVLTMTATPIPRSLALTLYGEMDISIIDQKPDNRLAIKTELLRSSQRTKAYKDIDKQIEEGRQAFIVCPLIQEGEDQPLTSAESLYQQLSSNEFKHRRVALLHGKLKPQEKDQIMSKFVGGEFDILVSTTVIEVGVDVPNATVMLVENAERFGLAQLHQLRGRVGRSSHQGHCYLLLSDLVEPTRRLRAIASSNDGFRLAEMDMEIRGPGAIYGIMQHGQLDLRIAKLSDTKLIAAARSAAAEFIDKQENLIQYKELNKRVQKLRAVVNLN